MWQTRSLCKRALSPGGLGQGPGKRAVYSGLAPFLILAAVSKGQSFQLDLILPFQETLVTSTAD